MHSFLFSREDWKWPKQPLNHFHCAAAEMPQDALHANLFMAWSQPKFWEKKKTKAEDKDPKFSNPRK